VASLSPQPLYDGLEGKVAVVTGAGSGQGRAVAARFAGAGALVAAFDIDGPAVRDLAARVERVVPFEVDIAAAEAVAGAFEDVRTSMGQTSVLAAVAGIWPDPRPLTELSHDDIQRPFAVNLFGTFSCAREAVRDMLARGRGGRIILWSSGGARRASAHASVYDATKSGLEAMGRALAAELGRHGITVNVISPGLIDTPMSIGTNLDLYAPMIPVGRVGTPDDVAELALFLCSAGAGFINGATLDIDGGTTSTNGMSAAVRHLIERSAIGR